MQKLSDGFKVVNKNPSLVAVKELVGIDLPTAHVALNPAWWQNYIIELNAGLRKVLYMNQEPLDLSHHKLFLAI